MSFGVRLLLCVLGCAALGSLASCSYECGPLTCAAGCCANNVCFEGGGQSGGVTCPDAPKLPNTSCGQVYSLCSGSSCCPTDEEGNALKCESYCRTSCGNYGSPCNASLPCCKDTQSTYNLICVSERCADCINKGKECDPARTTQCCPGASCKLKPGFSTVYECQ